MKRFAVVMITLGLGLGAPAASLADGMPGGIPAAAPAAPAPAATAAPAAPTPAGPSAYTQAMEIGYAAAAQGDYQTALINFRRALALRPGDPYARQAASNMENYIAEQREAARRREIAALQSQLETAVGQRDWACAAATVDRLTTYFAATSLERARLVAYRGEISGFLSARTDIENWSTVCPGTI